MLTRTRILVSLNVSALILGVTLVTAANELPGDALVFEADVRPIFAQHCLGCHTKKSYKGELNLSDAAGVRRGGELGEIVVAGEVDSSRLFELVESGAMPPDEKKRLGTAEIAKIKRWIEDGARFATTSNADSAPLSEHDVVPIMLRRCTMCHGPEYTEGGLDLRTRKSMLSGGANGPAIVPGSPPDSRLLQRVTSRSCPPKKDLGEAGIEPMTSAEFAIVERWIAAGAALPMDEFPGGSAIDQISEEDRQFWSFRPPIKPRVPAVQATSRVRNPIDAFVLRKLESHELTLAPDAERQTMLRRVTLALTGLPPTTAEMARFAADGGPDAYERLVDRLLASPAYGERWGRFWLDLAGYADSEGKRQADVVRPNAYRYRDYVIRAFNADLPYDAFLTEQLAGDEMVDYACEEEVTPVVIERLVATGFLRMAPDGTSADPVNRVSDRVEVIADEIDVLSRSVLGLTMNCARCHSHKYDPIPQRDYYRLVAIFKGAYDEFDWLTPQPFGNQWIKAKRRFLEVMTSDQRQQLIDHNRPIKTEIAAVREQLKDPAIGAKPKKALQKQLTTLQATLRQPTQIRALWDRGRPSPTYLYRRGDDTQPVRPVEPGIPAVLEDEQHPYEVQVPSHASPKTGRRLALARWLTRPNHPLTARVLVNRIWQQQFGQGIVKTADNFGRLGTPPTHPQLLDWLAVEFVEHGWSIKHVHRLIVTSTAFRQASGITAEHELHDLDNALLSRMPMRRLSAEEVRDSLLAVSGQLSLRPFGVPDPVKVEKDGLVVAIVSPQGRRRSIYVRQRRKEMPTLLETFDLPQMNPNCTQRRNSTVVSQPLFLLNNRTVYELAASFASRVRSEVGDDPTAQFERAFLLAYARPPSDEERQVGLRSLVELSKLWQSRAEKQPAGKLPVSERALADLCHILLNSAAFLFVD
jgi:mono/diheme cytochrome c family protein